MSNYANYHHHRLGIQQAAEFTLRLSVQILYE